MLESSVQDRHSAALQRFAIGDWVVDLGSGELRRGENHHRLDPIELAVLAHLVEATPGLVSSDDLLARNWPGMVVGDNVLHRVIASLRRTLGDDARHPTYIETLPKRGYRLVAPVSAVPQELPHAKLEQADFPRNRVRLRWRPRSLVVATSLLVTSVAGIVWWSPESPEPLTSREPTTVAVLPPRDLSAGEDLSWLAEGLAYELSQQIGELPGYATVPRISLGEGTPENVPGGVDLLLDGYLQAHSGGVEAVVELVDVANDKRIWSQAFEGSAADPRHLQSEIAGRILTYFGATAQAVDAGPYGREAQIAYFKYLRHRAGWGGDKQQITYWLGRTLELDPAWGKGYVDLALTHIGWTDDATIARARDALDTARDLGMAADPDWNYARALMMWGVDGKFNEAEGVLRALARDTWIGRYGYAELMMNSGLFAEARGYWEHAARVRRFDPTVWYHLATARTLTNDLDGAHEALTYIKVLTGQTYSNVLLPLVWLLPHSGRTSEAHELLTFAREQSRDENWYRANMGLKSSLELEIARAARNTDQIAEVFERWDRNDPTYYVLLGMQNLYLGKPQTGPITTPAVDMARMGNAIRLLFTGPELRQHPRVREWQDSLGFTDDWRLELCKRASTLADQTHINCDPDRYRERRGDLGGRTGPL